MIKLVYIIHSLKIGGSQKVMLDGINALPKSEYEIHVISLSPEDLNDSILNQTSLTHPSKVYYFEYCFPNDYSLLGYLKLLFKPITAFKDATAIRHLINTIQPHIIHFHTNPRELIIKKFLQVNAIFVFTDHTLRLEQNRYSRFSRFVLAKIYQRLYKTFHVITISKTIQASLKRYQIPDLRKQCLQILNGVDTEQFAPVETQSTSLNLSVIYVSRLDEAKGHDDLLRAWASLTDIPNKHLYLVGTGAQHLQLQALADTLAIRSSVTFVGAVNAPIAWLKRANVGVFPSYKEGLPLALLEKMAMRLPVIVSNIPELTDIISHQQNGLVFELGNSKALANCLRSVYNHPEMANSLGINARTTVVEKYNAKLNHKKLAMVYKSLVNPLTNSIP